MLEDIVEAENLRWAWRRVKRNGDTVGADGQTPAVFAQELDARLDRLAARVRAASYQPGPLRRLVVAKPDGGERRLAIPTVTDRVLQTATHRILAARLNGEMSPASFAYRAGLGVDLAVARIVMLRLRGYTHVVEADIRRFFDEVPHAALLATLDERVADARVRRLVRLWLRGFGAGRGLAQGAPISPLLANLHLDPIDRAIDTRKTRLIRYADDLVLLCRSAAGAQRAQVRLTELLVQRGLALHPDKTRQVTFERGFDFLGYRFEGALVSRLEPRRAVSGPSGSTSSPTAALPSCSIRTDGGNG